MLNDANLQSRSPTNGAPELPGVNTTKPSGRRGGKGGDRAGVGRKNGDGSTETLKIKPLKEGTKECMRLYMRAEEAKSAYNAATTAVAERGNINTSTLRKLISSSAKGKFEDVRQKIEQADIVFREVGEVSSGSVTGSDDPEEK
jgi:hypothetical protein